MPTKILINGYQGKMGQAAAQAIRTATDLELVGGSEREDDLAKIIKDTGAEVVLDLTTADAVYRNAEIIMNANVHPVIGTSGLSAEQIKTLGQRCSEKKLGAIVVPNFSLGAVLMMHYAEHAARYFKAVEIIEAHHPAKKDAPSGTARKTAQLIQAAQGDDKEVPIHSLRLPGIVAEQSVIFGAPGETLSIQHRSIDRDCFMPGILLACRKVIELDYLLYGLDKLVIDES